MWESIKVMTKVITQDISTLFSLPFLSCFSPHYVLTVFIAECANEASTEGAGRLLFEVTLQRKKAILIVHNCT